MKRRLYLLLLVFFMIHLLFTSQVLAEGSKQIRNPDSTGYGSLDIASGTTPFATYGCAQNYRLKIHIKDTAESILMGFGQIQYSRTYRLKRPDGTVVLTGTLPANASQTGYITYYHQCVVGPFSTMGGYTPLQFNVPNTFPATTDTGDYYLEFSGNLTIGLFDITVVSGAHIPPIPNDVIDGRVFSASWQFYANLSGPFEPYNAPLYVFSDDGIVTKLKFNQAHVGLVTVFCNPHGCLNTGVFATDRQSKNSNTSTTGTFPAIAQFKVFFNNPDSTVYPSGVYGQMVGNPTIIPDPNPSVCSGKKIIRINVNKTGNVSIKIDVPYGGPSYDTTLYASVVPGLNNVYWDGKDGHGNMVPDGTQISIIVTYANGLTNLPIWDQEQNPNGYVVTLIRPTNTAIQNPMVYWDDSQLTNAGGGEPCNPAPQSVNLNGCIPAAIGCHVWPAPDCHNKMINTWWYSASSSTATLNLFFTGTPPDPINHNSSRCGPGTDTLYVTVQPYQTADWYSSITGGTLLKQGDTMFITPYLSATATYYAEARNDSSNCLSSSRTPVTATIIPIPDVIFSPPSQSICTGVYCNIVLTSIGVNPSFTWTATVSSPNITGSSPGSGNLIKQLLSNSGNSPGTVTYHVVATAEGCTGPSYDVVVTVNPTPDLSNNPASKQQCNNLATNITLNSNVTGTLFTWTVTPSSFQVTGWTNNSTPSVTINDLLVNTGFNIETVTYHATPQINGCIGVTTDFIVTVYPTPNLSNIPAAKQICNNSSTNVNLTSNVSGTAFTWTATPSSAQITGWANNIIPRTTINDLLINSGYNLETVTYHITPNANGCDGPVTDYVVTVYPTPDLSNNPKNKSQCNNLSTNITLTSNVSGTLFTWIASPSSAQVTGWNNNNTPSVTINDLLVNTGFNVETVTYHIAPHAHGCDGVVTDFVVTVYPTPNLSNNPKSKSQCNNLATGITLTSNVAGTLFTWTATPSSAQVTGWNNNNTPSVSINDLLVNSGFAIETVTYHITPLANGCSGAITDYVVTVYPTPDLSNNPKSKSQCNNLATGITLTSNVTGSQFTWTATPSSAQVTGWNNNNTPKVTINDLLVNSGYNIETVTYHITPVANSCSGAVTDYVVTVYPTPDLSNNPKSKSQCNNLATNITLNSNVSGTLFTWTAAPSSAQVTGWNNNITPSVTINDLLINSGFTIETVTYHITPHANGCAGTVTDYVVTVYPTPNLSNSPAAKQICNNTSTNVTLTSNVSGSQFTWTATPSSAQVTGWNDNITPSVTINDLLVNSGFTIETVTYHITPRANGCDGPVTDYVVTVYPTPDLSNNPKNKSQCNNLATGISLTSNISGTLFTWTATPSSAQVTGWNNNITPSVNINDLLVNTGFNIETVTYHITPHANGCNGVVTDFVVTVYPTPNLSNNPKSKSQCNNLATGITLTSNVAGTLFTWTATPSSAQVTGWNNNIIPSVSINDLLVNSGFAIETVTYHITPLANGCSGAVTDYVVTVYPTPDLLNNPKSKSQCNNLATGITLTSNVTGSQFTWTATPSSAQVTGWANNNTPSVTINDLLVNSGYNIETVTYHITPLANGCSGAVTDYVVTVYPTPDLSNNPKSKSQCNNLATNITLNSNVSGTLFTWTAAPSSAQVTGWNNNITPSVTINDLLINSGFTIETVTYHITPHANGCAGTVTDYVVTVYPTPNLSNSPAAKQICNNTSTNVTLTSNVTGSQFTWTATPSSAQVTGWNNNITPSVTINDLLVNSGFSIETVTYHITPRANGCDGPVTDFVVTVYPTPDLSNNPKNKSQCNNLATGISLTSNISGTLFTWTATPSSAQVTGWNNNITPSVTINDLLVNTGFNIETVTYHITPHANGCNGVVTDFVVTVYPTPNLSNNPKSKSQCNNLATGISLTSNVSGTLFTWTVTPSSAQVTGWNNNITPSTTINDLLVNSGSNIETVTYHITPLANGCSGAVTDYVVTVYPTPDLSNNPQNKTQCNNQFTNILLTSNAAGTLFTWTCTPSSANITGWSNSVTPGTLINQTLINASLFAESVTYHITPHANGCDGPVTDFVVTVIFKPALTNSPASEAICNNTGTNLTLTGNVSGTLFTWKAYPGSGSVSGYSSNTTTPTNILNQTLVNASNISQTVTYRIVPHASGCEGDSTDYVVTVQPTPNLTTLPLNKSQCNNLATGITLTSNVAGTLFTWTATPSSAQVTGWNNNITPSVTINDLLVNSGFSIETVTYHITPRANGCDGPVTDYVLTVYPTPDLSNNPKNKSQCNNLATGISLTSNISGTLFTWTASPSSAQVTGWNNNNTPSVTINDLLVNTGFNIETVTYHITPHANGCNGVVTDFVVTVYPTPNLSNNPKSKSQCNNLATGITLTSNVAGTLFTWTATPSSAQVTGWNNNITPSITINDLLVNSGFAIETVTYHITPLANGCSGAVTDYVVTVYPTPDLSNNPKSKSQCNNLATGITLTSNVTGSQFTWTATPSSAQVTGWANNNTPSVTINDLLVNSGYNIETVTYHITPLANGCSGAVTDYVVTVYPTPDLSNNPKSKSQCNNLATNITLNSNVSGTLFTWTAAPSSAQVTGWNNNITPSVTINDLLINSGFTIETVTYHITPHANGCAGTVTDYVVTVYPTPNLSNSPAAKQICNNTSTNVTLTSNVAGTLFTWTATPSSAQVTGWNNNITPSVTINDLLVNSGFTIETVTYHITPRANGCDGPVTDYVVTVYPTPDLSNNPKNKSQCNNLATGISLTSNISGTLFTWTVSPSSAQVTGWNNNITPSVTINDLLVNTGFNIETVTYHITPHANGCDGVVTDFVVTVYPTPLLTTSPLAQTICTNSPILVNLTSTVAGSSFTWTCTPSSPNLSGYANGNTSQISQTLSNSGFTIETVTYHIIPAANSCSGPMTDYVVTVNPKPDVSNSPLSNQICSGTSPMINLTSNVANANFSWTATPSSAFVTGYSPGSGILINQVLTNTGFNIETVTYHITPTANACTGNTVDFVVTIVSVPDVYFSPAAQTICSASFTNIQVLSHVVGATFSWTALSSSPNITGFFNDAGNLIAQPLLNSGNTIENVTYTVTPAAFGCPVGIPQNVVATVNPKPAITNTVRTQQTCSSQNVSITPLSTVTGSSYSWVASGSSPNVTGFSNGSGLNLTHTLVNSGFNIETVTYVITPTANTCPGDTAHFQVIVFPVADVYFTPATQSICPMQSTNVSINSHVALTTFTWTATGTSLASGYLPGAGTVIQQVLNNTGYNIETVTYHVTPLANGCTGSSNNLIVSIDPNPSVTFVPCWDEFTTTNAKPFRLKGASPPGGTFSGTGVSANNFYPAVAGAGTFTINYNFTNSYGCFANAPQTITVLNPLPFSCGNSLTDIRDNKTYPTVIIGTQCWMAANLDYGNPISGNLTQRDNCSSEKFCYNDNPGNCSSYGGLYQWDEMMKFENTAGMQGYCPPEWHIPTEADWGTLFASYISNGFAGSALKSTGYSGYNAFLYGARFKNVSWNFFDFSTLFWSSTPRGSTKAWAHGMNPYDPSVSYYPNSRLNALSVRCIKD